MKGHLEYIVGEILVNFCVEGNRIKAIFEAIDEAGYKVVPKEGTFHCKCGCPITLAEVDYNNKCNELGEEYHTVEAECPDCKKEYSCEDWGEVSDPLEAFENLMNAYGKS